VSLDPDWLSEDERATLGRTAPVDPIAEDARVWMQTLIDAHSAPAPVMPEITPAQERAILEAAARKEFRIFVHLMHEELSAGRPFDEQEFHVTLMSFLQRTYDGEFQACDINIPPRFGKTYIVCLWIAFGLGTYADSRFMYICSTDKLANQSSDLIKRIMATGLYHKLFPKTWIDRKNDSKELTKTTAGGEMMFCGIGSTITGFAAGIKGVDDRFSGAVIMDDLHKLQEARSELSKDEVIRIVGETVSSRRNSMRTPFVIIGQRAALDDIFSKLHQENDTTSILGVKVHNLTLPALGPNDRSVWEGGASTEWLHAKRKATPWMFATQYMQQPYNMSGSAFQVDMIPVLDVRPAGRRIPCRSWDLAARELKKGRTEPDFTASGLLVYYPDARIYVIEDAFQFRARPEIVRGKILATAARDGFAVPIRLPQEPGQAGVDQMMNLAEMLAGYKVFFSTAREDKMARAEPFASQVNLGRVAVLAHLADFVREQLRPFPDSAHDDFVDAISDAFAQLAIPDEDELSRRKSIAALEKASQFEYGPGLTREEINPDRPAPVGYFPGEGDV